MITFFIPKKKNTIFLGWFRKMYYLCTVNNKSGA